MRDKFGEIRELVLTKKYKLKRNNDFKKILEAGQSYQEDFIKLKILKNNLAITRFGSIVGLKISKKASQRNKIKRQLEEVIQRSLDKIKPGFDVVILVSPVIKEKNYQEIEKALIKLFKQSKVLWNF